MSRFSAYRPARRGKIIGQAHRGPVDHDAKQMLRTEGNPSLTVVDESRGELRPEDDDSLYPGSVAGSRLELFLDACRASQSARPDPAEDHRLLGLSGSAFGASMFVSPVMPTRGVLDTSTVILLSRITDPATLPAEPLITAVTLAELAVGPLVADEESERTARQAHLQQAEADFDPLPFDADAARAFGRVAASLRRKASARAYDAMIAATALANDLPLYTCNPADFASISGLEVVAVPVPA
jgi:tRNA(fMet)-specific endonuclease VapC